MTDRTPAHDPGCTACPRLADYLTDIAGRWPDYHAAPVPSFGVAAPPLLVVGLAPGLHGANRTGRPFTGDYAGVLLYRTLHRFGFASAAESVAADDGLRLDGCRIVNAVKCVPPQNKPIGKEIANCNNYLRHELDAQPDQSVVLALGRIAHQAVLRALGLRAAHYAFAHGARHELSQGRVLFDSYHCSRYNVQTRRLTEAMFINVFEALLPDVRRAA